jgi:hypothetical protein
MEERFAWAVGRGHAVVVLACELLGLEALEQRNPGLTPRVLGALAMALEPAFGAAEALVAREERALLVFLVGPDPRRLEGACRDWLARLRELRVDGVAGPLRAQAKLGYAVSEAGRRLFLDTLIQVALEGLRVARCHGPGACVHTMLYNLVQSRLEAERGGMGLVVVSSEPLAPEGPAREPGAEAARVLEPRVSRDGTDAESPRVATDPAPLRGSASTDDGRRERELLAVLAAERSEKQALQARLRALERGPPPSDSAGDTSKAPAGLDRSTLDRIDQLERRLAKLRTLLAESEERLARAVQAETVDSGVASTYRTVQGLASDTPLRTQKAALMEQIFAANLALNEILRGRRAS